MCMETNSPFSKPARLDDETNSNWERVITIQSWFDLRRFRTDFPVSSKKVFRLPQNINDE